MRHPLVRAVPVRVVADDSDDDVVTLRRAVGSIVGGEVGDPQQDVAQVALDVFGLPGQVGLGVTQAPALVHGRLRAGGVTAPAEPAHLLGQLVDPPPQIVALAGQVPLLAIELEGGVELLQQLRLPAPSHGRPHAGRVGAEAPDVDHGRRGYWPHRSPGQAVLRRGRGQSASTGDSRSATSASAA